MTHARMIAWCRAPWPLVALLTIATSAWAGDAAAANPTLTDLFVTGRTIFVFIGIAIGALHGYNVWCQARNNWHAGPPLSEARVREIYREEWQRDIEAAVVNALERMRFRSTDVGALTVTIDRDTEGR